MPSHLGGHVARFDSKEDPHEENLLWPAIFNLRIAYGRIVHLCYILFTLVVRIPK